MSPGDRVFFFFPRQGPRPLPPALKGPARTIAFSQVSSDGAWTILVLGSSFFPPLPCFFPFPPVLLLPPRNLFSRWVFFAPLPCFFISPLFSFSPKRLSHTPRYNRRRHKGPCLHKGRPWPYSLHSNHNHATITPILWRSLAVPAQSRQQSHQQSRSGRWGAGFVIVQTMIKKNF